MMSTPDLLRQLQAADSAIDAARTRLATVHATLTDRSEYEAARSEHTSRTEARRRAEAEQRDLELEAATLRQQSSDVEQRLYGGTVRNAHEVQDLNKHSGQLKHQIAAGEDRLLQALDATEQATRAHVEAEQRLRTVVAERRQTEASLLEERKGLVKTIEEQQAERDRLRGQIDAAALKNYDGLRRRLGGLAVAAVTQRTCQGCRVSLIAAVEQRLRQGNEVVHCQSCGRILYLAP
jgi:predicted  nucleic acid-binding Zn-ribbon protein